MSGGISLVLVKLKISVHFGRSKKKMGQKLCHKMHHRPINCL